MTPVPQVDLQGKRHSPSVLIPKRLKGKGKPPPKRGLCGVITLCLCFFRFGTYFAVTLGCSNGFCTSNYLPSFDSKQSAPGKRNSE